MLLKDLPRAVQIYGAAPSQLDVAVNTTEGYPVNYQLLSLPFYLTGQLPRLLSNG